MAALNVTTYPMSVSSTVEPDWGIVPDYTDGGVLLRRGLYPLRYYIITARWDLLDLAGRDYLEGFFDGNQLEPITFTLDGHDYTAEVLVPPARRWVSGTLYGISVTLRGTRTVVA